MPETHLRDDVQMDGNEYVMIGNGHRNQEKLGGRVDFLHRKENNLKVEQLDVANSAMSENILAL